MTSKSLLLIVVSLLALSACSSVEEKPFSSGLQNLCKMQAVGSHQRIKTVGYVTAALRGMPSSQSNNRNLSSPHLAMAIFQVANTSENMVVLSSQPERQLDVGLKAETVFFIIPKSMFERLESGDDFRIKTSNGGTAAYNDKVEVIFDSFNAGGTKGCVSTIEEIRKI